MVATTAFCDLLCSAVGPVQNERCASDTYLDENFDERCGEGITTVEVFYERFVGNRGLYFLELRALDGAGARNELSIGWLRRR